jgi:hypothetical protein
MGTAETRRAVVGGFVALSPPFGAPPAPVAGRRLALGLLLLGLVLHLDCDGAHHLGGAVICGRVEEQ